MKKLLTITRDFFKSTFKFIGPVLFFHLVLLGVVVPLLIGATNYVLNSREIDYLSYDNVFSIIIQHPFIALSLLVILALTLVFIFLEFTFLIVLVHFINKKEKITLMQLLYITFSRLKHIRPSTIGFFLLYFLIVMPFSGMASNMDIVSTIRMPNFIVQFIASSNWKLLTAYLIITIIIMYIAYRLIFVLPLIILRKEKLKTAWRNSWQLTKRKLWTFAFRYFIMSAIIYLSFWALTHGLVMLQEVADKSLSHSSLALAMISMTVIQVLSMLYMILSMLFLFYVIVNLLEEVSPTGEMLDLKKFKKRKILSISWKVLIGVGIVLLVFVDMIANYQYLTNNDLSTPVIISHRGVSDGQGVQNTIPAMIKTNQEHHPDYVEMDIRQTSDKQFVVMHDENLKTLAGKDIIVENSTLAELTKLTVKEHGYEAKIPSFDDYLKEADKLHQKLLIEIKVPSHADVNAVAQNFVNRYKADIDAHGHQVHSLNFKIAEAVKDKHPSTFVSYIMIYNFIGVPKANTDAFSVETSTLNAQFVDKAHSYNKKVYAWDVNDINTIQRMRFYNVDGLITDNAGLVKNTLENSEQLTYAEKLNIYLLDLGNTELTDAITNATTQTDTSGM